MVLHQSGWRKAFVTAEVLCVMGVIALLLAIGFAVHSGVRLAANVAVAESNLNQVATAMDLYFRQYNAYPPQGSDLAEELAPFIDDPAIFSNPLMNEHTPGETLSRLYRAPTNDEVDRPSYYLTALLSNNGHTSVVLWTGHRVERHEDIPFNPRDPSAFHASLDPASSSSTDTGSGSTGGSGGSLDAPGQTKAVGGGLNINPRNNNQFEFSMTTTKLDLDGNPVVITRDDLLADPHLTYTGGATHIRVCPKGNGNQNSLTLDGVPTSVSNGTLIMIDANMTVNLFNANHITTIKDSQGKAMGQWWIQIAATDATYTQGL